MNICELAGYAACVMVFIAFYMKDIMMVRIVGLCSNFAFLTYGLGLHLLPVAALHMALIPVNCWRLCELLRERRFRPR